MDFSLLPNETLYITKGQICKFASRCPMGNDCLGAGVHERADRFECDLKEMKRLYRGKKNRSTKKRPLA